MANYVIINHEGAKGNDIAAVASTLKQAIKEAEFAVNNYAKASTIYKKVKTVRN
jgi:hypothetical protein